MNSEILKEYTYLTEIGKGTFGNVYLAVNLARQEVAIKKVKKLSGTNREVETWSNLDHPNILHLQRWIEDHQYTYLVTDYCSAGTLLTWILDDALSQSEVKALFCQMVEGVSYLHSNWIIHRDLSVTNIYLTADMSVKIGDFGLAVQTGPGQKHTGFCGNPDYMAPEIVLRIPYGPKVDIWSLGSILFDLLVGHPPFLADTDEGKCILISKGNFSVPSSLSDDAQDLICSLLKMKPSERLPLVEVLHHLFLRNKLSVNPQLVAHTQAVDMFQTAQAPGISSTSSVKAAQPPVPALPTMPASTPEQPSPVSTTKPQTISMCPIPALPSVPGVPTSKCIPEMTASDPISFLFSIPAPPSATDIPTISTALQAQAIPLTKASPKALSPSPTTVLPSVPALPPSVPLSLTMPSTSLDLPPVQATATILDANPASSSVTSTVSPLASISKGTAISLPAIIETQSASPPLATSQKPNSPQATSAPLQHTYEECTREWWESEVERIREEINHDHFNFIPIIASDLNEWWEQECKCATGNIDQKSLH